MEAAAEQLPDVPGYRLVRPLGRGGSGEVFEAVRIGPGGFRKHVALKRLLADRALSGRARARFFQEAQLTAHLEHPNLVRVHDVIEAGGEAFIVMELLRGATLAAVAEALRQRGEVPWWVPLAIAAQALDGLAYAHVARGDDGEPLGLVHRDLAPRNLFVCSDGTVKILDFGIAKQHAASLTTSQGQLAGTVEFLSPEQARGERVDPRSDLYQLAASVYWALSGKSPHGEGTTGELVARAAAGLRAPLEGVPAPVAAVIGRALALAPDERFADAAELAAAIRTQLVEHPQSKQELARLVADLAINHDVPQRTISVSGGGGTQPLIAAPPPSQEVPARQALRSSRARWQYWIAAGLLGAVVGATVLFLALGRRERAAATQSRPSRAVTWQRLGLPRGHIASARFAPGGDFVFAASWEGKEPQLQLYRGAPDPKPLGAFGAEIAAIDKDERILSVSSMGRSSGDPELRRVADATVTDRSGAQTAVVHGAVYADFDGRGDIVASRLEAGRAWIDWGGRRLLESTTSWYSLVRVAPGVDDVAVVEHPRRGDPHAFITVVGRNGSPHRWSPGEWDAITGLAWTPKLGLVISARRGDQPAQLVGLGANGPTDSWLAPTPGGVQLLDIAPDGRMLVAAVERTERWVANVEGTVRSLGTYAAVTPSRDGAWIAAIDRSGTRPRAVLMAATGATEPTPLGDGAAAAFSPDGTRVAVLAPSRDHLVVSALSGGGRVDIGLGDIREVSGLAFTPDGARIVVDGRTSARAGLFAVPAVGGAAIPFGIPDLHLVRDLAAPFSPDGSAVVLVHEGRPVVYSADGTRALGVAPESSAQHVIAGWTGDSKALFVALIGSMPVDLERFDLTTRETSRAGTFAPFDVAVTAALTPTWIAPDGSRGIGRELELPAALYLVGAVP